MASDGCQMILTDRTRTKSRVLYWNFFFCQNRTPENRLEHMHGAGAGDVVVVVVVVIIIVITLF